MNTGPSRRMPTYFISHGGGPWPWLGDTVDGFDHAALRASLECIPAEVGITPTAILVISGQWEADTFTVQTSPEPPMLYDYGGFPPWAYRIQYPAKGSPAIADRVIELLTENGIVVRGNAQRGYSHGTYSPLSVAWPQADVPVLELSIKRGYDVDEHLATGRALAPLRDQGVLIIGSGDSYHNHHLFTGPVARVASRLWDRRLGEILDGPPAERTQGLRRWDEAPGARTAHEREDHLMPLMVVVGAAEQEPAVRTYHQTDFGGDATVSGYRFGAGLTANACT